jgi:serine/threonine protein kinase
MKYCSVCNEKFEDTVSFCPKDGEVLEEDPSSLIGTVLDGQYQIEGVLGKGGMGAVYRARHILLGDRVAIKVLPPEMRSNTEWLRRFQREGQAARRFRHPNAVTVYDLRTSGDGTIYLVMECVEGNTLDAEVRKHGKFSAADAVAVLDPIMSVLNAAHAMGVVHRDLKPENIMIGKPSTGGEPVVKLLDLGIAKLREVAGAEKTGNTNLTIAGQMLGTPYYMSPEQWGELPDDGNSEIDGRADIYSLGVVFYELITGQRPFSGVTLAELRRQHVSVVPKSLHEVDASVPENFSKAIARSIAKDRSERQATANELRDELIEALATGGIALTSSLGAGLSTGASIAASPTSRDESQGRLTLPQRTAATIVGESEVEPESEIVAGANILSHAATMPTVIGGASEKAEPAFSVPYAAAGSIQSAPASAPVVAPPRRRSPVLFLGAALIVLLLIVGGGGFAVIHFMTGKTPSNPSRSDSSNGPNGTDVAGGHELGRYWVEVNTPNKSDAVRAGDPLTMPSGEKFKFHFSPSENGYLYILGPGNKNAPTTFLTAKPAAAYGVKTNEVKSGQDFAFPGDTGKTENWLNLDESPGTDEFTVIFSSVALAHPDFLGSPALHELTVDEQKQLNDFLSQAKPNLLGTETVKTGASPFVSVKIPQNARDDASVVFKIWIEHK